MGWRIRRSIKILPGIRLNFGKRGYTSTTVGKGLFSTNINSKGARNNYNVPGTGITYQGERVPLATGTKTSSAAGWAVVGVLTVVVAMCAICGGLGSRGPNTTPAANATAAAPLKSSYLPGPSPTAASRVKKGKQTSATAAPYALVEPGGGKTVRPPLVPSGATAICSDGTTSYSSSRRGTCSHHGGVSKWL